MLGLVSALSVFVLLHSVPAIPDVKARIVHAIGRTRYLAVYSIVSTAALAWLFYEALNTDYVELWAPALWEIHVAFLTAPIGLFLVVSGLLSPNPFSATLRRDGHVAGAIVRVTRHPVLWGFFFWAIGHVFANGDARAIVLFGGFAVFSIGGIVMAERRARNRLDTTWARLARGTSITPFLAILTDRTAPRLDWPVIAGILVSSTVTAWLLMGDHAALFGADPIETLRSLQ